MSRTRCPCGLDINASQMAAHLSGARHQAELRRRGAAGTMGHSPDSNMPALSTTGSLCSCGLVVKLNSERQREEHLRGRRHQQTVQSVPATQGVPEAHDNTTAQPATNASTPEQLPQIPSTAVRCDVCKILLDSMQAYVAHKHGQAHNRALTELAFASTLNTVSGYVRCPICERDLPAARWDAHLAQDQYHRKREQYADITAQVQSAHLNRSGISVTGEAGGIDFGIVEVADVRGLSTEQTMKISVSNEVERSLISMTSIQFSSAYRRNSGSSFSASILGASRFVNFGKPRTIVVTFHSSCIGRFEDTLELEFHDVHRKERFVLLRRVLAVVGPAEDYEFLKPKGPYGRPVFVPLEREPRAVATARPPTWSKVRWAVNLPEFPIPEWMRTALNTTDRKKTVAQVRKHMPTVFNMETYGKYWSTILHAEEWQQSLNLSRYNMFQVPLHEVRSRYRLYVPGLEEQKPRLIVGDKMLLCHSSGDTWHEGIGHAVEFKQVILRINPKFKLRHTGDPVDVRFQVNRMPWRRRQQAVTLSVNQSRLLFPEVRDAANLRRPTAADMESFSFKDPWLTDNQEQQSVVAAIVNSPPGSVPFIIFGPPGTGKTVTLVEAASQILTTRPEARLLLCTPTNDAADLIAYMLTLKGFTPSEIFRLNAIWRPMKTWHQKELKKFSMINRNDVYAIPEATALKSFRVVVATCVSAAVPYSLGIERGWFTHVFVDEAGQCIEPDSMIPLKLMADEATNIVLAGDIKQLGPVVHSTISVEFGLKNSYMQRLMNMPVYDLDTYSGVTIMKLLKHFRSHPAIIAYPNQSFYANQLLPCGDPAITHSMLRSTVLDGLNPKFPLIFHGVTGCDMQEEGSPSYFNIEEASIVAKYCHELVSDRKVPISAKSIGVISPYTAQCRKIRALLGRMSIETDDLKVGTTEAFQGQERKVIIISTVRSNPAHALSDIRQRLGFVGDAQRFNVAITRARALLIVVGDPSVLCLDGVWRGFLAYVKQNGGWRGKEGGLGPDSGSDAGGNPAQSSAEEEVAELIQRIQSLSFQGATGWTVPNPEGDETDPDDEAYDDRPPMLDD